MAMNALEFYNNVQEYIHSNQFLSKNEEEKKQRLETYNAHLQKLQKQESADMDDEEFEAYKAQFKPYEANKQFTPQGRSSEFAKRIQEVKSTDNWKNLSDEDKTKANKIIGQKYRELRLAEGLPIEPVEYDAKADAAQNTVKEWTGIEPQNQPQQVNDLSWKTGAKSVGKSLGRVPGSLVSTGMGAAGFGYDLLGSGLQVLPWQWTKDLGQLSKDTGAVLGTAANAVDTFNRNILPPEQKQSSSIGEWWNDRNAEQKVLGILDEAPEQFFTFVLPMLTGNAAAKSAQLARDGKLGGWLGNLLNKISANPKYAKWFKDSAKGLEKGLASANKLLSGIDPQKAYKKGAYLGSSLLEASEMAKNAYRNQGEIRSPLNMLGHALVAGKLESLVPEKLGGVFSPQTRAMLRRDFGKGAWKSSAHFLKNLGKDTLYNMVEEGLTELAQTYVEQSADMYNSKGLTADGIAPIHDINSAFETLKKDGINGLLKEAGRNERIADIFMATILGGITGGVGTASAHPVNYISYNSSPEGYLDRYRENREALINDIDNAKTDEERKQKQQQLDQLDEDLKRWELSNPDNARQGRLNSILRSFEEMANPETSDEDLKDSLRDLSEYSDDMLLDYADLLQKAGWESNGTFDKNLDKLIKYKEDINFKTLSKEEQNRILDEREESERQARKAELDRIKAENEAKEKTEKLNLESKLANGLLQHAIQQNWTEQDAINKFLRGEQLTSSEEGIVNKVFEKYSGQTTDISQALNQELVTLKNDEKNLWNQLNPNGSTQQTAQKPRQLHPVKLKNNNQAIAPQQTVQKNPQIQSIHNEINKLRQQKIKDEQEKEQLRQQLVEQQKTGSNANIQGQPFQNGKRGFIGNKARLKAGDIETKCNYAVVELSDLQTLTDEENPRQRNDRKAYANTVSERARNLDPDLLIDNSVGAQNGPIVVDQNLKVESGNGRTLSLREAYANRKGEGEYSNTETDAGYGKADIYRNKLIAEAPKYGISSEQVMQMKEPVLVRIRVADSNVNAKDFWAKANNSQQESMSSTETALVDGEKVKPFLNQFEAIGDIRAKSNLEFVRSFLEKICSPYELNSMFTADGRSLSEAGEKRINNAIIASAYGNSEIVSLLTELGNEEIQTILNGLAMAAPDTAKLMGEVKSGAVHNVDFSKDLADAIRTIKNIRQNPDMNRLIKQFGSVSEVYLRQGLLGDDGLSPTARLFIGALGNLNNKETICNFLKSVNNTVRAEGNPNQLGMFEANTKPSDEVFVERTIRNMGLEYRNGKPIADDIERLKQGPAHVASNDDFHAEDAQGRRYSLDSEDNPTFIKTESGKEEYGFIDINSAKEISKNAGRNVESAPIKVTTRLESHLKDDRFKRLTELGYKSPKELVEDIAKNFRYVYEGKDGSLILVKDTSDNSLAYIQLKKSEKGNYYEVESIIPTVRSDYFNKKKKLLDKAQSNHISKTNTPSAISGGSFSNLSISENDDLSSRRNSLSDSEDYRTEAERLADDGTTATREEFDNVIQNVNDSIDPDAGISFEIYDSVEDFNKGRADNDKAPSDANAFIATKTDKKTGKKTSKIVLFRDKLTTLTRLKQVVAHELVGHEGIERLLGGRYYDVFLKSIRKLASRDSRVGKLLAQVQRTYGRFYASESHQMYEELGAHLAELYARKPERFSDRVHNYIRKLKVMFRNALRNWGVDIEFNQVDLEDIFAKAREAVETTNVKEYYTNDSGRRYSIGSDGQRMTDPEKDNLSDMWKELEGEDSFEEEFEGEDFATLMDQIDQPRSTVQSPSSDARFSLASKLDPSKVTSDDVVDLLERAKQTEFNDGTYIPVRADTPNIIIESAKNRLGLNIPNLPMIMNVGKARDAMEEKTNTKASQSETRHTHGLSPYLMVDILKKLDKPKYIFYQKDNGYITEFVTVRDINNNKVHAVIDFYKTKPANELNGYYGGIFNVVVTLLDRNKKSAEDYMKDKDNVMIYPTYRANSEGASSNHSDNLVSSYVYEAPSNNIVTENSDNGNQGEDTDINNIPAPRHYSLASDKELKRVSDHIGKYFNKNNMTSDEVETAILESVKNYGMNWIKIENYLKGKGLESGDFDDELANMVIEADEAIMENKKLNSKVYQSLKEYYEKNKLEKIANYIAQYNIDPERPGFIKLARDKVLDAINDGLNKYVYGGKYDYTNFLKYIKNRYDLRIPYKQLDKIAEAVYYNPIKKEDSGTLEDWLERNYDYDKNGELKTESGNIRFSLTSPDESIEHFRNRISDKYGITKFNDYIHVQKKLLKYLPETFYGNVIVNSTGDIIRISRRTIKETFDKPNYADLPTLIKLCKLEILNNIPALLRDSARNVSDAENYHGGNKTTNFDYYETPVEINGKPCKVQFDVKKSVEGNKLHLYRIEIKNESSLNLPHHDNDMGIQSSDSFDNRVSQNEEKSRINEIPSVKRFSLSSPVEQTKNLIAVHNLHEDELLESLNLGGLPMPSIAIVKDSMGHDNYGEISVVFNKDTIDPKKSKYNKVYSGDAYTPALSNKIGYKFNTDKIREINNKLEALGAGSQCVDSINLREFAESHNGDFIGQYKKQLPFKSAFLKEKNIDFDKVYYERNGRKYISMATEANADEALKGHEEEYSQWLDNLFNGVVEKIGIRNSKTYYTPNGTPRNFESLHYDWNLENIVKALMEETTKGENAGGHMNLFASASKEYKNIEDIKKDSYRLRQEEPDKYTELLSSFNRRMDNIARECIDERFKDDYYEYIESKNTLCRAIAKYKTKTAIEKYLEKTHLQLKSDTVDKLIALREDIRKMPTTYFEAKPQRAVGLDEIEAVIIPDTTSQKTIDTINNAGIRTVTYDASNENDRLKKLNEVADSKENIRFSLAGTKAKTANIATLDEARQMLADGAIYSSEDNGRRYSLNRAPKSIEEYRQMEARPLPEAVKFNSIKELYDIYKDNYLGQTITTPSGHTMTFKPGHFFRLICHKDNEKRKGFIEKANSPQEAIQMIENGDVQSEDITGFDGFRAKAMLRYKEVIEDPDFYYPEQKQLKDGTIRNCITFGRKYNGFSGDGFLAATLIVDDNKIGPLTFHPKKFKDKILKNKNLVWKTLENPTTNAPLNGETVGKQSVEPNNILQQISQNRNPAEYTDRNDQNGNPYGSAKEGRGYSFSSGKPVIGYIVDMVGKKMNNKDRESLQNAIEADAYKYDTERTEPKTEGVVTANGFYYPYIREGNYTFTVLGEYKKEPNARKKLEKGLLYYNGYRRWLDESGTEHDIPSRKDRHNSRSDSPVTDSSGDSGEYMDTEGLDSSELQPQNEKIPWLGRDKEESGETAGVRPYVSEGDIRPEQSAKRTGTFERKSDGEYEEAKRRFSLSSDSNYDYNKNEEDSGRRYSLNQFLDSGTRFVDVKANQEEFDGLSDKQKINKAIKIIKDKFAQKVIGIDNRVFVNSSQAKEYGYPPKEINDKDIINAKMRASTELDNLVDAGTNFRTEEDGKDGHIHPDAKNFEYFDVLFKVGDQFYKGVINIKNNNRGRLFYDITKIENVTKDQTDSTGNIPAFGFLRDISMPDEKSSDKFSIAENSDNRNPAEDDNSDSSNSKRVYSLGSTIEQQRKQFEDYVDGKIGIKLSDDEKDTIKAILETDDDADLDLNDIPTFGERLGNAKESLKTFLGQLITGLIGDTESRADRKKAPYLWQKDHSTENVVETPYEISRRTKIEQGMKTREEEDRLVLKHLDADKNLFTGLIRKWTKPGALQDWMLKKASRILAPFQIMKPVEQLLFTVAENIMWDEAKQQMVIAPYRDTEYDKQTNRPIGYKYDPNEKNGRLALDIYNNKLNDEFKAIIKERSIANNKFREDFVNRVVPFEQAKLYLARFGRKRLEGASKKIVEGNDQQAYSYIIKLKGVIDDLDYNNLISQYDQIKSIPDEQLGRNSAFINSIIGELAGNPAITTNGIDAKLNWLTTNKGLYGYAHHLVSIDPETGNGKPFNALGKISHPWIESIAGDRRGRKGDNSEYRSLLRADLERNRKEAEAEAANRWMEATENTYGITLEEAKNLEKLQKQGKGPGMPEGYEHRHKVVANFGKFRGKVIYLPDETFEAYQMIKDNRSLDSMKQFREFIQKMNNLNGRINEAMLWHPGKAMRDLMSGPFHLLEFLRDWSMKHPTEINDAAKAIWHGVKNSVSPEYWQSHSPESMGEYSESVIYQTQEGQSPTFGFIDSLFKYFQRAIPVGRTLEAMYKEINFAGGADIPLKRIFTTVGEELADKRGLTGQERERFIYDLVNDYAFDTGDLPEILGWLRGKKPDSKSQALGMISRATVPFMGYATRMIKQMITDPVTKGAIPLAKRAFGNVDSDSNLRSEISEISRPFFWLMLKALIAAGLGGILPPPTAEEIQDMPGVPPSARTHGRFYVGDSDKGERWMSTKGLGQLETAYIMDDYLKGKSDIIDFSSEFLTIHPVMKYIANLSGLYSEYDRKVPFTTQTGKMLAGLIFPELTTRFTEDINKLVRAYMQVGTADRRKQTFIQAFIEKLFGIPAGEVQFDKEGHLRLSDPAIETMKMFGINIREIPFDTIEETTRAEASRISNDAKRIKKLEDYRAGKYSPKTEQEFLKQDFGGDFSSVAEAENYYSNLAERERKLVDTATKLHKKGHWTDLEDVAREKKELAAEKKKQQNEGKPSRRRPSRRKTSARPLLNDDLGFINNEIRKNISREEEYQELYDKLMQNNKKHNPRRGVAGQLERLLKELK